MKVWERLNNFLAGLVVGISAIIFFSLFLGQVDFMVDQLRWIHSLGIWWLFGIFMVLSLIAFFTIGLSLRIRREEKTIINQTQFGEIRITIVAIENLVLRATRRIKGVKDAHVGIRADLTGLDIFIEVTVNPDLSIPQISEEIRAKVDEYIFDTVGIRVNSVKVLVTRVAGEMRTRVE
ncbi:MAG TPA: alkaline shock response membrane anchor protein AmaP [Bacillota bacterium]|nr:alkaline shock response membrane anchor protein AmaP [Bacillota bacterium]